MSGGDWRLTRSPSGRLRLETAAGEVHDGVVAVRAFPVSAPGEAVALVDTAGRELVWIGTLSTLPDAGRRMVEEALAEREFLPEIQRLAAISRTAAPSVWSVETDRGATRFVLRGEEDVRRLGGGRLLVTDESGIHYLIRDEAALDRHSRRLLEHFL
jgi:hypothetical protein